MAAQLVKALPEGTEWLYEPKLDGYRASLLKDGEEVQILSRNEKELAQIYPRSVATGSRLNVQQTVLDGDRHRGRRTAAEAVKVPGAGIVAIIGADERFIEPAVHVRALQPALIEAARTIAPRRLLRLVSALRARLDSTARRRLSMRCCYALNAMSSRATSKPRISTARRRRFAAAGLSAVRAGRTEAPRYDDQRLCRDARVLSS